MVLLNEALRLGGKLRNGADVVDVGLSTEDPYVVLQTGERISADVIVGADGIHCFG